MRPRNIFQSTLDQMAQNLDGVEVIMGDLIAAGDGTTQDDLLQIFL